MKKLYCYCIFLFSTLFTFSIAAQTVTGVVTSAEDGLPLIGVNILVKGTVIGTITDVDGSYTLEVGRAGDTISFSYTGFETQNVPVAGRSRLDVVMQVSAAALSEIVVIGYGTMRKSDLTGSVYTVRGEDLVKNPDSNPLQALQGKVPGVQVSSASGNPGDSPVVRIRGVATFLGGASPVYVVDGIILDNISFLNNADIESIEVLKDASATAIYGSRGANGVIIITTKRGKSGKPVINAGVTYSQEYVSNKIDLLDRDEFAAIANELFPGTYNNVDALPNTDWQEEVFDDGAPIQKYDLSLAGGAENYNLYLSGSLYDQQGVVPKSDYRRFSLKLNNTLQAASFLKLGADLSFSKEDKTNPPNVVFTAYRAAPVYAPYNADGTFAEVPFTGNPLADIEFSNNTGDRVRSLGNLYADLSFLKNFTFRTSYQMDWNFFESRSFSPVYFVSNTQMNAENDLTKLEAENRTWIWENTLRYGQEIGKHRFDLLAGYSLQETENEFLSASVERLLRQDASFWYISAGDPTSVRSSNGAEIFSYMSWLARANYTFDNKYLLTATFRRDGSSKFGPESRFGNFPSVAVGWRISEEAFLENSPFDNLKLRASWGIIGNDKINYRSRFSSATIADLEAVFGAGEVLVPGATITRAGNPALQWEETETLDAGLEFALLNNRLSGEIDYYNKNTNDVLVELRLPGSFGNGSGRVVYNAADVRNQGLELYLNWKDRKGKFSYSVGGNLSSLKNEVLDIRAADDYIIAGSLGNGQDVTYTTIGGTIGAFYGLEVIGVFQNQAEVDALPNLSLQAPGDFIFRDVNNDDKISLDDRVVLGSYIPDVLAGLNFSVGYQGLELLVDFQGQFGNEIYNGKRAIRPDLYNYEGIIRDRWMGEGSSNTQPRATVGGGNYSASDWFIEDGSFIRLRSVALSYSLPAVLTRKMRLQTATFFLRGTNLVTWTEYSGYSPEIANENVLGSGIDLGGYPVTSVYSLGLNVGF